MNIHPPSPIFSSRPWPAAYRLLLGLVLLLLAAGNLRAQDGNSSPPMGPSGDYDGTVTTAGSYDSYTLNARRAVTDLVVPGSNGTYPLAFTRYSNSQTFSPYYTSPCFGDGGNWRHSYQWSVGPLSSTAYQVNYPDGSVVVFRSYTDPNYNPYAPPNEDHTFWRGPTGTNDRLQVNSSNQVTLWTTDGGQVCFGTVQSSIIAYAARIIDPYGAVTLLAYNGSTGYVTTVTEPGGRTLSFTYGTFTAQYASPPKPVSWSVLTGVTASTGQSVTFVYNTFGTKNGGGYYPPYCGLQNVIYNAEPATGNPAAVSATKTNPNACVLATYNYGQLVTYGTPVLASAVDPHYAGPMTSIQYCFAAPGSTVPYGIVQSECNSSTGGVVSGVSQPAPSNGVTTSTETRGDVASGGAAITRSFNFGETSVTPPNQASDTTYANAAMLTSRTDWQGNKTYYTYFGPGNANGSGTGNLREVFDAQGNRTAYVREAITGKTTEFDLPDGRKRFWQYSNAANNNALYPYYLQQSTDERGQTTVYHRYGNTGLVYQIDYPDQSHEYFSYQGFGGNGGAYYKVATYTNKLGAQFTYSYGANNNNSAHNDVLLSVTRKYTNTAGASVSETTSFQYDAMDRLIWTQDPGGVVTQFSYTARHQLLRTTHAADGTHMDNTYDDLGNGISVSDEMGHTVTATYDGYRRPTVVVTPVNDGANSQRADYFYYDPRDGGSNSLSPATSHTRSAWSIHQQQSGKAVERVFTPNNWLSIAYYGCVASSGGANGSVNFGGSAGFAYVSASYNAIGEMVTSVDAQQQTTTYGYDNCGRKTSATDPLGHQVIWTYYGVNQPSSSTNYAGWLQSVSAPGPDLNNTPRVTTTYTGYDAMGRVTSTVDPYNHTFVSGYDAAGDLTNQSDGAQSGGQHVTGYGFDQLGRKAWVNNAASTSDQAKWTYNASGTVHTYQNFAGATCTYTYDNRNRCTGYSWSDGATPTVSYAYDTASRLTSVSNWYASVGYTYDDSGAVLTEGQLHAGQSAALTTHYTHDADGNVTVIQDPDGFGPCYAYDAQQRCTGVYAGNTTFSTYTYSGDQLTERAMGNNVFTLYDYQANGRCWDVWHRTTDAQGNYKNISRHIYGYEPDGQISWFDRQADGGSSGSSLENGNGDAFAYYPDGSLSQHDRNVHYGGTANGANNWPYQGTNGKGDSQLTNTNPDGSNPTADTYKDTYVYDAAGNRTSAIQYNAQNNPTVKIGYSALGNNEYNGSAYDANYNTTNSAVGWTYAYDAENHLTSAGASGQSAGFEYDGLGRLVVQTVNGATTHFYYAGDQRVEERDASNDILENYMFDAPGSDQILMRQGQDGTVWYQYDLMGNTSHLTNNAGQVVEQYLYDCYGTPSVYNAAGTSLAGTTVDNRYLFKGADAYEWIAPMGTYYARARFYLPFHGRFLQPDPIGQAGGLNIYTYCGNDPVNGADPGGLWDDRSPMPVQSYTGDGSSVDPPGSNISPDVGPEGLLPGPEPVDETPSASGGGTSDSPSSGGDASSSDPGAQPRQGGASPLVPASGGVQSNNNATPGTSLLGLAGAVNINSGGTGTNALTGGGGAVNIPRGSRTATGVFATGSGRLQFTMSGLYQSVPDSTMRAVLNLDLNFLSVEQNAGPNSPFISHFGYSNDSTPDQDTIGGRGAYNAVLNAWSLAIRPSTGRAWGLYPRGPVFIDHFYIGNWDDIGPARNWVIDAYDPQGLRHSDGWGGILPGKYHMIGPW